MKLQILKQHTNANRAQMRASKGRLEGLTISIFILTLFLLPVHSMAQDYSETSTITAAFADNSHPENKFQLLNINGNVTIEAYDGETVQLTVTEQFDGTSAEIERAKNELTYRIERKGNLILAWLETPFTELEFDDGDYEYDWNDSDRFDDDDLNFTHDVHVRVPRNILVKSSAMNGDVHLIGSFRDIETESLNGNVELTNITSKAVASTLNGNITVTYNKAPTSGAKFKTLNGNIDVTVPADLSADIYFESLMGDFYTNFENLKHLKQEVSKNANRNISSVTYKIDGFSPVRIGDGDIELRFDVLNGNAYLRKN